MMKRFDKRLLGRDPTMGILAIKCGVIPTRKDRLKNRNSKLARVALRRLLSREDN